MSDWRVKLKPLERIRGKGVTWELQRRDKIWDDPTMVDMRDGDEWEYANFGESKTREEAVKEAMKAKRGIQEEERIEAEAEYVDLD